MAIHDNVAPLSLDERLASFADAAEKCRDEEAEALCLSFTPEFIPGLLAYITDGNSLDLRWWAIRGLAVCADRENAKQLASLLRDPEPELRAVAALTLGRIGQRQSENDDGVSLESDETLLNGIATLLTDVDGSVRQAASDALVGFGVRAIPALQTVLEHGPENARVRAAYALRKIGAHAEVAKVAPALFQLLNDSNYLVHTYAHEALDELGLLDNVLVVL